MSANQAAGDNVRAPAMREKTTKVQQRRFNIAPMMDGPTERDSIIDSWCLDGPQELHVVPLGVLFSSALCRLVRASICVSDFTAGV